MAIDRQRLIEQTGAQVSTMSGVSDILYQYMPAAYSTYREMRKDPTIALARALLCAVVLTSEWSLEADDEVDNERLKFITDEVVSKRQALLEAAVFGGIDFGWAPFELVYEVKANGLIGLNKIKSLLQDITTVLIVSTNGEFRGYRQKGPDGNTIDVDKDYCLHIAFRIEGTNWYGQPLLENARASYNCWNRANAGADRYDKKIAGSHFVVYYPVGKTTYKGALTENSEIAKTILQTLESSGSVSIPDELREFEASQNEDKPRWRIEILEDKGSRQPGFIERLKYLDALKVRALLMPERAILEGQFGTKAEAGVHADMGVLNIQLLDQTVADEVNKQVVDKLLELNYGPEAKGTIRIEPAPLVDDQLIILKTIYNQIMTNAQGFAEEFSTIDTDAIKDKLGVPKRTEVAQAGETPQDNVLPPPLPTEPERQQIEGSFTPRTERGRWTYDGAGLMDLYGPELEPADVAFTTARKLADEGKFDEARAKLFSIPRPSNHKAHFAVQRRMSQMLERFMRIEIKAVTAKKVA